MDQMISHFWNCLKLFQVLAFSGWAETYSLDLNWTDIKGMYTVSCDENDDFLIFMVRKEGSYEDCLN